MARRTKMSKPTIFKPSPKPKDKRAPGDEDDEPYVREDDVDDWS